MPPLPSSPSLIDNAIAQPQSITLYLEVFVNQTRHPALIRVTQSDNDLYIDTSALAQLGFLVDSFSTSGPLALSSLTELDMEYRAETQQLFLTAPLHMLAVKTTRLSSVSTDTFPVASASPGALLNYDLYVSRDGDVRQASAATEFRLFGFGHGVLSHSSITRSQRYPDEDWQSHTVALATFNEWSFPETATRLIVGDTLSGGLSWTRPLRLGGIQYGRHFDLQPYQTTTPLASFLGKATLPSSVELYIDGIQRYQADVPVGPFELTTAPNIVGAGQAQLVTRDILGRVTTLTIPFYNSQQLLAQGLSDWSVSAGVVREEYGIRSFHYDDALVGMGHLRYGLTSQLTVEAHGETSGQLRNGGLGFIWQPQQAGVISLAHARSDEGAESGHQTAWQYRWNNARYHFSLASQRRYGQYRDVASRYGNAPANISEQLIMGMSTSHWGNIGLTATRFHSGARDERPSRYAGTYWNHSIANGVFINAAYNQNLNDQQDRSLQIGLHISFGRDYQFSSTVQHDSGQNSYRASMQRSLPSDGGYGWRLQSQHGEQFRRSAIEGSFLGRYGQIDAGVADNDDEHASYLQARGGLVWMNRDLFASRHINDGFAIVDTAGMANIPVKLENRLIGQTDHDGHLLVTRLNAWQHNHLSIDPLDLPADKQVIQVDHIATPSDRAGTVVQFAIETVHAALIKITNAQGDLLPVGSPVHLMHDPEQTAYIGFDGETYLTHLRDHNRIRVVTDGMTCLAEFPYNKQANSINYIGPIPCLTEQTRQ